MSSTGFEGQQVLHVEARPAPGGQAEDGNHCQAWYASASTEQLVGGARLGESGRLQRSAADQHSWIHCTGVWKIAREAAHVRGRGTGEGHGPRAQAVAGAAQADYLAFFLPLKRKNLAFFLQSGAPQFWGPCAVGHFGPPHRRASKQ